MAEVVVPTGYYYTREHEWARLDGDTVIVGISDHAQNELGDITFVELPENGQHVHQGDELLVIESVKAASDVYAPVSGEVIAVNEELNESPEIINNDPYNDGWLCKLKLDDLAELEDLSSAQEYRETLGPEE